MMHNEIDAEQLAQVEHLADLGTPLEHIVEKTGVPEETVRTLLYGERDGA